MMGFGYKFTIATSRNACLINERNTQPVLMIKLQPTNPISSENIKIPAAGHTKLPSANLYQFHSAILSLIAKNLAFTF